MLLNVCPNLRILALLFVVLFHVSSKAQEVHLLADLTPKQSDRHYSNPQNYISFQGFTYFFASTDYAHLELWRTDGTQEGTSRVYSFGHNTYLSSSANSVILYKNNLYFSLSHPDYGRELWKSDGTTRGTGLFMDIYPGILASRPGDFYIYNDKLFFSATDELHGRELWQTDGTVAGTEVMDVISGPGNLSPENLTESNGKLFFRAAVTGVANNYELWVSDGTRKGTKNVRRIAPGNESSYVFDITPFDDGVYFTARDGSIRHQELWKSDGTFSGTQKVFAVSKSTYTGPMQLHMLNGLLHFIHGTTEHGLELWQSDGTASGSKMLVDLNPGRAEGVTRTPIKVLEDQLYFLGTNGQVGIEIWKTDGTVAGTKQVTGFTEVSGSNTRVTDMGQALNGKLYFTAFDLFGDRELYVSDGTPDGTKLLKNLSEEGSGSPRYFFVINNRLFFTATDGLHGLEPWTSNGTETGTYMLKNINARTQDSQPAGYTGFGDKLVFTASNGNKVTMYGSDGTAENTGPLISSVDTDSIPSTGMGSLIAYKKGIYFMGSTAKHGAELWYTEGASENTYLFKDIIKGSNHSAPTFFTIMDNVLYFSIHNDFWGHSELYRTKGTVETTRQIKSLWGESARSNITSLVGADHQIFYTVSTAENGSELYVSDGTEAGSKMLKDICPGTCNGSNFLYQAGVDGHVLYFTANNNKEGSELWRSDGTKEGTRMVKDINPGFANSTPQILGRIGPNLIFAAYGDDKGRELWISDGTEDGTQLLMDIYEGLGSSNPMNGIVVDSLVYFTANNGSHGTELWRTDGTTDGTFMAADVNAGSYQSKPNSMVVLNDTLYFVAGHADYGREVWKFHPSFSGKAKLVTDIMKGPTDSRPYALTVIGNRLYFSATHPDYGSEVFYFEDPNVIAPTIPETDEEMAKIILYPNPANQRVTLTWPNDHDQEFIIGVYDILGKELYQKTSNNSRLTLDITGYESGTYVVKIEGLGAVKFIKY